METILASFVISCLLITSSILGFLVYQLQKDYNQWFKKYIELEDKYYEVLIRYDELNKDK